MRGLALALLLAGCAHIPPAPPDLLNAAGLERLYCVEHVKGRCVVYRSAQPGRQQFEILEQRYGVNAVVKLNFGEDPTTPDMLSVEVPMLPAGPVSRGDMTRALDAIDALLQGGKTVLIHCTHGQDRTGLVIALWRLRHGALNIAAVGEMLAYGFHTDLLGLVWTARQWGLEL